jgi:hypothetical protein
MEVFMLKFLVIICFALGLSSAHAQGVTTAVRKITGLFSKSQIELAVEKNSTIETIDVVAKSASWKDLARARREAIRIGANIEVINTLTNEMTIRTEESLSPIELAIIKGYSRKTINDLIHSSTKADIYAALKLAVDKGLSEEIISDLSSALLPQETSPNRN